MMPTEIVLATGNQGKVREIRQLLAGLPLRLLSLADFPGLEMPAEEGATFAENARQKAGFVVRQTGKWTLADDSGLVVPWLDGAPGIFSARYAGPDADDRRNCEKLLADLAGVPAADREAYFVCELVLAAPDGSYYPFTGRCPGRIATAPRGSEGFGYDPIFLLPPDFRQTMAEISLAAKQRLSHRGQALRQLLAWLEAQRPAAETPSGCQ
jgi:XTP/dITP diphosphohydrolase